MGLDKYETHECDVIVSLVFIQPHYSNLRSLIIPIETRRT